MDREEKKIWKEFMWSGLNVLDHFKMQDLEVLVMYGEAVGLRL